MMPASSMDARMPDDGPRAYGRVGSLAGVVLVYLYAVVLLEAAARGAPPGPLAAWIGSAQLLFSAGALVPLVPLVGFAVVHRHRPGFAGLVRLAFLAWILLLARILLPGAGAGVVSPAGAGSVVALWSAVAGVVTLSVAIALLLAIAARSLVGPSVLQDAGRWVTTYRVVAAASASERRAWAAPASDARISVRPGRAARRRGRLPLVAVMIGLFSVSLGVLVGGPGSAMACPGLPVCDWTLPPTPWQSDGIAARLVVRWVHGSVVLVLLATVAYGRARLPGAGASRRVRAAAGGALGLAVFQMAVTAVPAVVETPRVLADAHVVVGTALFGALVWWGLLERRESAVPAARTSRPTAAYARSRDGEIAAGRA